MHPHIKAYSNSFRSLTRKHPLLITRHAMMISSYLKTTVFIRPHVNKKLAFSKISSLESISEKMRFSVTIFTRYAWTVGQTREKNIRFQSKWIRLDRALVLISVPDHKMLGQASLKLSFPHHFYTTSTCSNNPPSCDYFSCHSA